MKQRSVWAKSVAIVLAVLTVASAAPLRAAEPAGDAALRGVVLSAETREPLAGAIVHAGRAEEGRIVSSAATGADGAFAIDGLDAAAWEIAVQSGEGLYLVDATVVVGAGETRRVDLLVARDADARTDAAGRRTVAAGVGGAWDNPLTATLIVIGGAVVAGLVVEELSDDDEDESSPF